MIRNVKFSLVLIFNFLFTNSLFSQVISPKFSDSIVVGEKIDFLFKVSENTFQELFYSIDNNIWFDVGIFSNQEKYNWMPPKGDFDSISFRYNSFSFSKPIKIRELGAAHNGEISSLDFSYNDSIFLSSGLDGFLFLWHLGSFKKIDSLNFGGRIYSAKFLKNSKRIVFVSDNSIYLFEPGSPNPLKLIDTCLNLVRALDVHIESGLFAYGSYSGEIAIYDSNLTNLFSLQTGKQIYSLQFSHNGELLAFGDYDGLVSILDLKDKKIFAEFSTNRDSSFKNVVWSVGFDSKDSLIVCGGIDGKVRIFSILNRKLEYVLPSHMFHIRGVNFCDYAPVVSSVSLDSTFSQILYSKNFAIHQPIKHNSSITALTFIEGGRYVLIGLRNGSIIFYKNFDFNDLKQEVTLRYFIPIVVKCKSFNSIVNRLESIPIVLENIFEVPLKKYNSNTSYAVIKLPKEHFGIYHPETSKLVLGDRDTILSSITMIGRTDTFATFLAYILHPWSDRKANYSVENINFRGKTNLLWLVKVDTVEIVETCKPLTELMRFELIPKVEFNLHEDSKENEFWINIVASDKIFCKLEMYNLFGKKIKDVFSGEVEKGQNIIRAQFQNLESGMYVIVMQTKYQKLAKKLILFK